VCTLVATSMARQRATHQGRRPRPAPVIRVGRLCLLACSTPTGPPQVPACSTPTWPPPARACSAPRSLPPPQRRPRTVPSPSQWRRRRHAPAPPVGRRPWPARAPPRGRRMLPSPLRPLPCQEPRHPVMRWRGGQGVVGGELEVGRAIAGEALGICSPWQLRQSDWIRQNRTKRWMKMMPAHSIFREEEVRGVIKWRRYWGDNSGKLSCG
jgi:hypothetical protein